MEGNSVLVAKGEAEEKGEKEKTSEAGHQKGAQEVEEGEVPEEASGLYPEDCKDWASLCPHLWATQ